MITIATPLMAQIIQAAEESYPNECCGLLAGFGDFDDDVTITQVRHSNNVAEEGPYDRFEVDPKVRFDLMRELEDSPQRVIGHYHSHPDHPAKPSARDLEMAFEPDLLWLIIALTNGHVTETSIHRVDTNKPAFIQMPLTTI